MSRFLRHFWSASACLLALAAGLSVHAESAGPVTIPQWRRWEHALTAQKPHSAPYTSVVVDVLCTGPHEATLQVPAFWDDERGFRFRAAFPTAGTWRWRTTCNDPTDAGLHGQAGEVQVTPASGDNALYRHGDLRVSDDRRYLVHADRTPFLWLGDTAWLVALKATDAEWREYVDVRAGQRFSVLQIIATGGLGSRNTARPSDVRPAFLGDGTPDPGFWRSLEEKIGYANDRGLVVMLTGVGKSRAGLAAQQLTSEFARYLVGRLAGHMVVLSPSMDEHFNEENNAAGARLHALTTHLVTQHPGTHFETIQKFHDENYADFCGVQSGHRNGDLNLAYQGAREWNLEMWQRAPVKPLIHLEAMYDGRGNDNGPNWREQDVRKLAWLGWLSGARGYTYGAGDTAPKVPKGDGGIWRFRDNPPAYDYWRKALQWPSAAQMTHLRDFFSAFEWWRLEPAPQLVQNQAEEATRKIVTARSASGDLLVAYLPDNPEVILDLTAMPPGLQGRWFNPVTGESAPVTEALPVQSAVSLHRPRAWGDATLLLTKSANGR